MAKFGSSEAGSKGGKARAKRLTKAQRSAVAKKAADARWGSIHQATHTGDLNLGDLSIPCAVLEDGTRVLSERGILSGLGIKYGGALSASSKGDAGAAKLPMYLGYSSLRSFIDSDLFALLQDPIRYRAITGGNPAHGLKAELLPKVCDVWLKARDADVLTQHQRGIAAKADILMRGLAEVGIVSLIDEATGFQDERDRDALAKILEAFVAKELRKWVKTFQPEYYEGLCKLWGVPYPPLKKNFPQYFGTLTNNIVYDRIAPGVRRALQDKNPKDRTGQRKNKHHQYLTEDKGHPALREHLSAVAALMAVASSKEVFLKMLDKAKPKQPDMPLFDN